MICCPPLVAVQLLQRATHAPMSHFGSSSSVVKDMSESSCRVFAQVMCAVTLRLSVTEMSNCVVTGALPHHFAVGGAPSRTSHVNTSHVTRHTSRVTRHASHVTRHTSHVTRHNQIGRSLSRGRDRVLQRLPSVTLASFMSHASASNTVCVHLITCYRRVRNACCLRVVTCCPGRVHRGR